MEGILPVWKPAGMTSHDVVAKARRLLKMKRIGHTGTLDPMVTGVLPLCLGKATRLVEYIQELPKAYEAELTFGIRTDTEDWTGQVLEERAQVKLAEDRIDAALAQFVGDIEQVPPMYSAVKVDGRKLYELAREGVEIERKARKVTIYAIEKLAFSASLDQPKLRFRVSCSKGTYIRTLCVDIGRALGLPAMMSGLTRIGTGPFTQSNCVPLEQLPDHVAAGDWSRWLVPPDRAVAHLPEIRLSRQEAKRSAMGQTVAVPEEAADLRADQLVRLYDAGSGVFIGIYAIDASGRWIKPGKVFITPDELPG